jgi:hypothetical protein
MMLIAVPFLFLLFPFDRVDNLLLYLGECVAGSLFFLIGQAGFFAAMRYFEASRLSSLLGLKIIVLSFIFIICGGDLNLWQMMAVLIAAAAALLLNWSGSEKSSFMGWLMLMIALVFFSLVDIVETDLVTKMQKFSGYSAFRSALAVVPLLYSVLGILTLPMLFFYGKPVKDQYKKSFPYAVLWLLSQVLLLCCYAFLKPVFGNVILATRGVFSVFAGLLLPYLGLAVLDSQIPLSLWIRRILASLLMLGAIALYSFASL